MPSNKTDRILGIAIGVLMLLLVGTIASTLREKVVRVGDKAPDFELVTDSGQRVTRSNFGGRLLVLNFWATWCPPCIEELPSLNELQQRLGGQGLVVLGVSVDKDGRAYREFLSKMQVRFLTARDPEAKISSAYGTFKFPETYVIDSRGRVVQKHIGARVWSDERILAQFRSLL
jgi:cytochrome c biogenesis protein CcmG/thiol:disulfide interchange protein DsbE